jgi:hypothetical protein
MEILDLATVLKWEGRVNTRFYPNKKKDSESLPYFQSLRHMFGQGFICLELGKLYIRAELV